MACTVEAQNRISNTRKELGDVKGGDLRFALPLSVERHRDGSTTAEYPDPSGNYISITFMGKRLLQVFRSKNTGFSIPEQQGIRVSSIRVSEGVNASSAMPVRDVILMGSDSSFEAPEVKRWTIEKGSLDIKGDDGSLISVTNGTFRVEEDGVHIENALSVSAKGSEREDPEAQEKALAKIVIDPEGIITFLKLKGNTRVATRGVINNSKKVILNLTTTGENNRVNGYPEIIGWKEEESEIKASEPEVFEREILPPTIPDAFADLVRRGK